jgi:hypothetical protein
VTSVVKICRGPFVPLLVMDLCGVPPFLQFLHLVANKDWSRCPTPTLLARATRLQGRERQWLEVQAMFCVSGHAISILTL